MYFHENENNYLKKYNSDLYRKIHITIAISVQIINMRFFWKLWSPSGGYHCDSVSLVCRSDISLSDKKLTWVVMRVCSSQSVSRCVFGSEAGEPDKINGIKLVWETFSTGSVPLTPEKPYKWKCRNTHLSLCLMCIGPKLWLWLLHRQSWIKKEVDMHWI